MKTNILSLLSVLCLLGLSQSALAGPLTGTYTVISNGCSKFLPVNGIVEVKADSNSFSLSLHVSAFGQDGLQAIADALPVGQTSSAGGPCAMCDGATLTEVGTYSIGDLAYNYELRATEKATPTRYDVIRSVEAKKSGRVLSYKDSGNAASSTACILKEK